jgi:ubiquinone/menaquinone biosynthesis C-methylase UbiE
MGREIDLMRRYPKPKGRMTERSNITDADREISRAFAFDYFDGDRRHGYGGFTYHSRFWTETVALFAQHYRLTDSSSILDIGCAKGFMLKDFALLLPGAQVARIDISEYAIGMSEPSIADSVQVGNATDLPFEDQTFDLVISINTIHNLERADCVRALREIERVSRGSAFVMVDGWKTPEEQQLLMEWVLTAWAMLSSEEWIALMCEAGYTGDYEFWHPLK